MVHSTRGSSTVRNSSIEALPSSNTNLVGASPSSSTSSSDAHRTLRAQAPKLHLLHRTLRSPTPKLHLLVPILWRGEILDEWHVKR